jgi:hypothetical protein
MTTYPTLLEQFLREECTPHVRNLICGASATSQARHEFEFNRFNVILDLEARRATITDELDVSAGGSAELPLEEFLVAVGCTGRSP